MSMSKPRHSLLIGAACFFGLGTQAAAVLNTDPFVLDRTFDGGVVIEDRFAATSTSTSQLPARLARLSNGDIVVAGLVQPAYSSSTFTPTNVGLVRYGPDGSRVPWTNPTPAYSYFNDMYLDYPNTSGAIFTSVDAVVALAGYIYVLADSYPSPGNHDADILAFGEDGHFVGIYGAFVTSLEERGVGLVPYSIPNCNGVASCPMLIAFANYYSAGGRTIVTTKRFAMGTSGFPAFVPNGTLTVDNTYGPYNNGANDFLAPNSTCVAGSNCNVWANAVTAVRTDSGYPTVYVGGYIDDSTGFMIASVIGVDGSSGLLLPDFGNAGFDEVDMNPPLVTGPTAVTAIAATTGGSRTDDDVFVVANVDMHCSPGVGAALLEGVSGGNPALWGKTGRAFYGGNDTYPCPTAYPATTAAAATIEGRRLVIAGKRMTHAPPSPDTIDYEVGIVRTDDGQILDDRTQHLVMSNGTPWGTPPDFYSGWSDVTGNGSGEFFLTGKLSDPNTGALIFGTTRIASDRIMGSSFD